MLNTPTRLLDILLRFENLALPVLPQWGEGLSDAQIDALVGDLPFKLPEEVRQYFRWKNGRRMGEVKYPHCLLPDGEIMSLGEAIQDYQALMALDNRRVTSQTQTNPALATDPYQLFEHNACWEQQWLPLFLDGSGGYYVAICDPKEVTTTPIYFIFLESPNGLMLAYDSLTSLFLTVVTAHETGAYWVDKEGCIQRDRAKLLSIQDALNPRRHAYLLQAAGNAKTLLDLVNALTRTDGDVSANATRALRLLGDASVVEPLLHQLQHERAGVRYSVIRILGELRDQRAIAPLKLAAAKDPDAFVRQQAEYALRQLNSA